jgi:hypothetical protein
MALAHRLGELELLTEWDTGLSASNWPTAATVESEPGSQLVPESSQVLEKVFAHLCAMAQVSRRSSTAPTSPQTSSTGTSSAWQEQSTEVAPRVQLRLLDRAESTFAWSVPNPDHVGDRAANSRNTFSEDDRLRLPLIG